MFKPRLSLVASPTATDPLRFDDPEFLEAIERDGADSGRANPPGFGSLAAVLGVKRASDYDFSDFIADGWVLHARPAITGAEEDALVTHAQGEGGKANSAAANEYLWSVWVLGVSIDGVDEKDMDDETAARIRALSHPQRKARGDAFGKLPTVIRDGFRARLRCHVDKVGRPADRDPGKTAPKDQTTGPSPVTGHSFSGDRSPNYEAAQ